MKADPIIMYQDALRKLQLATERAEYSVAVISEAADALRNWKEVYMQNISSLLWGEIAFSPSARVIDAKEWPTAQQLAETLLNWHRAFHAVQAAWDAIPQNQRLGLQPPPAVV